jgi:transcriptional regulator with GAF, ATPase, and Fis domain
MTRRRDPRRVGTQTCRRASGAVPVVRGAPEHRQRPVLGVRVPPLEPTTGDDQPRTLGAAVASVQSHLITASLTQTGSVDQSAAALGVDRSTLYKLMKRLGIPAPTRTLDRKKGHTEWRPWTKAPRRPLPAR